MKRHIGKGDVQSIGIMVRHAWMHRTQQHGTVAALSVVLSSGAQRARSRETMTQYLCFWWWSSCQNRTFPIYLCLYLYDMYSSNLTNSRMPFFVPSNRNMNHIEQSMVQAITWRTSQGAKRTRTGWCVRSWGHVGATRCYSCTQTTQWSSFFVSTKFWRTMNCISVVILLSTIVIFKSRCTLQFVSREMNASFGWYYVIKVLFICF